MSRYVAAGAFLSALLTFTVFITVKDNQFVALDDYAYIVNNTNIVSLNLDTIYWAFTSFHEGNWHPLTMISLAFDHALWRLNPFGYHLTNIAIHSLTVSCVCTIYSLMLKMNEGDSESVVHAKSDNLDICQTGFDGWAIVLGSIAGALFFGLHPLRVESVVWASERKDVLCMLFMTVSLWMYVKYVFRRIQQQNLPFWRFRNYWYALLLAVLAQMSKPTAVSLPLIFCLLDWFPFMRLTGRFSISRSLLEKIPFVAVSVFGATTTILAQQVAMKYAPDVDLFSRVLVACKALLFYLYVTIWPVGLTAFYMHPGNVASTALPEYIIYPVIFLIISIAVTLVGRQHKTWPVFWIFYVASLVPMLGLVQVGGQWAADRYSYLPSLGISFLWGGGVAYLSKRMFEGKNRLLVCIGLMTMASMMIFYSMQTLRQIQIWKTTETLATRIIDQAPNMSGAPYVARAIYRNETGQYEKALDDIEIAMKISLRRRLTRTYSEIAFEQAVILKNLGRFSEALNIMEWGLETLTTPPPQDAEALHLELSRLAGSKRK